MDHVRFGIAGMGSMGRGHATYITQDKSPRFSLAAVQDVDKDRASAGRQPIQGAALQQRL